MPESTFPAVEELLRASFRVEAERITPRARLLDLGLDSLALMEFVFAVEDRFSLRIPDDRLDPRQAGLTLADLCRALDEVLGSRPAAAA
ncbi:MAG: acyl carrier protein [Rubrivivax sp.]